MTTVDLIIAFTVVLCLLISFLFSGSETALTASSRAAMLRLEKQGNADAVIVNRLLAEREQMIGALLIGTNVANIAGSTLATGLFLEWFGDIGVVYATDAAHEKRVKVVLRFPPASHSDIIYPLCLIKGGPAPGAARRFIDFLRGDKGRGRLLDAGFMVHAP